MYIYKWGCTQNDLKILGKDLTRYIKQHTTANYSSEITGNNPPNILDWTKKSTSIGQYTKDSCTHADTNIKYFTNFVTKTGSNKWFFISKCSTSNKIFIKSKFKWISQMQRMQENSVQQAY